MNIFSRIKYSFLIAALACSCSNPDKGEVQTSLSNSYFEVNQEATESPELRELIKPYKEALDSEMNEVLVISEKVLEKGQPESRLGNLVADLTFQIGDTTFKTISGKSADFVILNYGGLRTSLPKGEITRRKAFELMPFENELVVLELTADKTKEAFDYLAKAGGQPISNASLKIRNHKPLNPLIDGKSIHPDSTYHIITTDYLAAGGDNMDFFSDPIEQINLEIKLRDAIIVYFQDLHSKGKVLSVKVDNRISYE